MWYYEFNGEQIGPVSEAELRARIADGAVTQSSLIWNEQMTDWKPAGRTLPDAFEGVWLDLDGVSASKGFTERSSRAPGSRTAKLAFALGIVSIIIGLLVGAIGIFLGFGAIFLGALVRNKTRRGDVPVPRHSRLAITTGMIGVVISLVNIVVGYLWMKQQGLL